MLTLSGVHSGGLRLPGKPGSGPDSATSLVQTLVLVSSSSKRVCLIRFVCLSNMS